MHRAKNIKLHDFWFFNTLNDVINLNRLDFVFGWSMIGSEQEGSNLNPSTNNQAEFFSHDK